MPRDERAADLAVAAAGLAAGAAVDLPEDLALWALAGGRPTRVAPQPAPDPARALVAALEGALTATERRLGAHYTPPALASQLVELALADRGPGPVADPACGGGAVLLAAADALAARGAEPADIVQGLVFGADIDPLAVAVAEAALALWSGGCAPPAGRLVVADALAGDPPPWTGRPPAGFAAVVGNPPFQGQLARPTARSGPAQSRLRARFGAAVSPYVDTAALFLLAALDLAADGGRVALLQPQSTAAARDAAPVRAAVAARARLVDLVAAEGQPFAARVHVCIPVLEAGRPDEDGDWARHLASARGVPAVALAERATIGSLAAAVAGFRQHYYGLVDHVRDGGDGAPLVTSGLLAVGRCEWGARPARFARRSWGRPTVDVDAVRHTDERLARWLDQVLRPKVVVASQTRVVEAAADRGGGWVPCTPVVSVVPHDPAEVDRVTAALCAPPVAAWAARRASGSGLSPDAIRLSASLALAVPLPVDAGAWSAATEALAAGDLAAFAGPATAMYALPRPDAAAVQAWWHASQ